MSGAKVGALNPNVAHPHYNRLMEISRDLLPALDGMASDAAIIASGEVLNAGGEQRLSANIETMSRALTSLDELNSSVAGMTTSEGLVVRAAIHGGFNNLLFGPRIFAETGADPEMADLVNLQSLHPFYRLYSDQLSLSRQGALVDITIDGDRAVKANNYYKTLPLPADIVEASEVVYGLVFSALLLSAGEHNVSLDFTAWVDDEQCMVEVENSDGIVAGALASIAGNVDLQPHFLQKVFAAGLSVHESTIQLMFRADRI